MTETADARSDNDRGTARRRAIRLYSWGSRAHWISTLFATRADMAVTLVALGLIGGVAAATINDAATRRGGDAGVAALTERLGESATVFGIVGRDATGRRSTFDIVVFDKSFAWVRGSTGDLERDGRILAPSVIRSDVLSLDVRRKLEGALEVIAVGAASSEGDLAAEIHRAGQRARQTAEWIAPLVPAATPIHTLNLGQYRVPCAACETEGTSWQRPFIVIAVKDKDPGADVAQALAAAMHGKSNLPSASAYSTFGLARFR